MTSLVLSLSLLNDEKLNEQMNERNNSFAALLMFYFLDEYFLEFLIKSMNSFSTFDLTDFFLYKKKPGAYIHKNDKDKR